MEVLKDERLKPYDKLSRYQQFPYYYNSLDDKYQVGTTSQLSTNTTYTSYRVRKGDTLDSIALKAYNNPTLYWVIADFNRIQDAFISLAAGEVLKIPTLSSIEFRRI